jgi:adenine-specific DNA-methyltransferase
MTGVAVVDKLPTNWVEREQLRDKGQFWTPEWVAKAMVSYVISNGSNLVFDPAFGKGAFYTALKTMSHDKDLKFYGIDIDTELVDKAKTECLNNCSVEVRDFIQNPPKRLFKSIVANPPYIRHHRLSDETKELLGGISLNALGKSLDGRAGIHVYFLIQALGLLELNGKLAFIMPSDTCEGIFANELWQWITSNYCLECVITFTPEATPFPNVDTNPIIYLIHNTQPRDNILWVKVSRSGTQELGEFVSSNLSSRSLPSLKIVARDLNEALTIGLSRDPYLATNSKYTLLQFATVMRGIATGDNDFFFLTKTVAKSNKIPKEFLIPAIGRTRDVDGSYITSGTLVKLESAGRPTLLFAPDGRKIDEFPKSVQKYLRKGELKGLPKKPLISSRKPWYKMENRNPPPFLVAYLGRRNARFIRNLAKVVPLTGFLCVYPNSDDTEYIDRLWDILQNRETVNNLNLVGKSYGSGAIKIEPRALERLPIPESLAQGLKGRTKIGE